jgi:hypothetical protein
MVRHELVALWEHAQATRMVLIVRARIVLPAQETCSLGPDRYKALAEPTGIHAVSLVHHLAHAKAHGWTAFHTPEPSRFLCRDFRSLPPAA